MERSQIDFLNHGILPFTGRNAELEEILQFWRETAGSSGLRAMLLVGEAGIGKSRLIEEASRRIVMAGGVVIHARLYPGAATSLAPLLARSLARSGNAQQLLKMEPEENTASVASAMIRICGLRPTLLVIEDMHLLQEDALNDFSLLLDMLADEPISLLCAVRPVTVPARSILERYLIGEMELAGLPGQEIAAICREVFGQSVSDEIVEILRNKTLGNALALRSALRAGVKPGTTSAAPRGQGDSILVDQRSFIETLERNVRLLSEGMVAHLSEQEKVAAEKLASLGEVFARDAALAILENGSTMLEALTFKGIVAGLVSAPSPLSGEMSESSPLAFTHTLLHRHFVDRQNFDPDAIICLLARELPLYSILPFPLLLESRAPLRSDPATIRLALMRALSMAMIVDRGANWGYAITIWEAASMLAGRIASTLEPEEWKEVRIRLGINKLALQRRDPGDDLHQLLEELLELTKEIRNARWVDYRLLALLYKRRQVVRQNPAAGLEMLKEVDEIVERYPEARSLRSYIGHLRDSARTALMMQDVNLARQIEIRVEELIEDNSISDRIRREAWILITSHFFSLFTTPEELQKRTRQLQQIETAAYDRATDLLIWKLEFLYTIGHVDDALATAEQGVQLYRERGLLAESLSCMALGIFARALLGEDTGKLTEELCQVVAAAPPSSRKRGQLMVAVHGSQIGLIIDRPEWRSMLLTTMEHTPRTIPPEQRILAALHEGGIPAVATLLDEMEEAPAPLMRSFAKLATTGDTAGFDSMIDEASALLDTPLLRLENIPYKRCVIDMALAAHQAQPHAGVLDAMLPGIQRALSVMSEWLAERSLSVVLGRLLERYASLYPKGKLKSWRGRVAAIASLRELAAMPPREEQRARISLLGSIMVQLPGEEPVRVRGSQLCTLLGLMAADRMLAKPLKPVEMMSIVIGTDRDPDSARKSMNFAVFRLREMLGSEAISTAGETPSLNLDLVEIDLLEAHRHLRLAASALRGGALLRAYPELLAALEITAGKVPFPTLYGEFFESAREDFETELRSVVIRVAHALMREGDGAAAEQVLTHAFQAMPDDEELAELLQQILRDLGKRAEAMRIGLREG